MSAFLTLDQVVELHDAIVPNAPVIDQGKLLSGIGRPRASFAGKYLHETVYEQAAALLEGVLQAHGFQDGNKRTAWIATVVFLEVNGIILRDIPQQAAADFVVDVANHKFDLKGIALWLAAHDEQNMRPLGR